MKASVCLVCALAVFSLATLVHASNTTAAAAAAAAASNDAECEIFDSYCVARSAHDKCSSTVIYPYQCANDPDESKCDFILDWRVDETRLDNGVLNFTLTWYGDGTNTSSNTWIGLIFSSDYQNEVKISVDSSSL